MRPTTGKAREGFFSHLAPRLHGARFLDLFSGSGIVGLEALSRGAGRVTFVEKDRKAAGVLRQTLRTFDVEATVIQADVLTVLHRMHRRDESFSVIYADPPYGYEDYGVLRDLVVPLIHGGEAAIEAARPHPLAGCCDRLLTYGTTAIACFLIPD